MEKNLAPARALNDSWILGKVANRLSVELPVVDAEVDAAICLADDDVWCSVGAVALLNYFLRQESPDVILHLFELVRWDRRYGWATGLGSVVRWDAAIWLGDWLGISGAVG